MPDHTLISLVLLDVDGCLNGGVYTPYDLERVIVLRDYNRRSADSPAYPSISICSGRPAPYVQALAQVLGLKMPALSEFGTVMIGLPGNGGIAFHPGMHPETPRRLAELHRLLLESWNAAENGVFGPSHFEFGKETNLVLFPEKGTSSHALVDQIQEILRDRDWNLSVTLFGWAPVVMQSDMDKGRGVRWLADHLGIALEEIAGFGDSPPDAAFLDIVGKAGVPANADDSVKNMPDRYVAAESDIAGAIAFYEECVKHNQRVLEEFSEDI